MNGLVTHRDGVQGVRWLPAIRRNACAVVNASASPSRVRTARERGTALDLRLNVTLPAVPCLRILPGALPTVVVACPRAAALPCAHATGVVNHDWGWTVR